jgi:Family of unknown function (DUF5684)
MYNNLEDLIAEMLVLVLVVVLIFGIPTIIGQWKTFEKAGQPGWAAIVPIYATIMVVQVSKKPMWWAAILLLGGLVPIVGPIASIVGRFIVCIALAKKYGKSDGFGVGLVFLPFIFYPILGFGDATYEGAEESKTDEEILDI